MSVLDEEVDDVEAHADDAHVIAIARGKLFITKEKR